MGTEERIELAIHTQGRQKVVAKTVKEFWRRENSRPRIRASNWVVYIWVEVLFRKIDLRNRPLQLLAAPVPPHLDGFTPLCLERPNSSLVKANCPKKLLFPNWGET